LSWYALASLPENSGWAYWLISRVTRPWSAPARTGQEGGVDDDSDRGEECGKQMNLTLIEPSGPKFELRTYKCIPCDIDESFLTAG
jgi:hypothetical protein